MTATTPEVRFERDIKPLFRDEDQQAMTWLLDLWDDADVVGHAPEILEQLAAGTMPCDDAWPATDVALFRRWIDGGAGALAHGPDGRASGETQRS